jgi:hypothetical protein
VGTLLREISALCREALRFPTHQVNATDYDFFTSFETGLAAGAGFAWAATRGAGAAPGIG